MNEDAITQYITGTFEGVEVVAASGNSFFFYDPGSTLPPDHRFPLATLVTSDEYDQFSNLNRAGVFRLNIGVSRETYRSLFGTPDPGNEPHSTDFTALDQIMPHPVYGQMHWICVLNPSADTFEKVKTLLAEAHARAVKKHPGVGTN